MDRKEERKMREEEGKRRKTRRLTLSSCSMDALRFPVVGFLALYLVPDLDFVRECYDAYLYD